MVLERYERQGEARSGTFGDVYKVWDTKLKVERAFKRVRVKDDVERAAVVHEAQLLVKLESDPNRIIVRLYDIIEGDTYVGLIMDWIEGETLTEYLRRQGTLGTAEALAITREVLQALEFAHSHRILHSDIKPGNVMRTKDGSIRLVDFGVARMLGNHSMGTAVGVTYAYAPPEFFQPPYKLDLRADLWAVGVMLYQLVTGKQPFTVEQGQSNNHFAWASAITPCQYTAPSDSTIAALLKRVLVPLDQRFPIATAFLTALTPMPQVSPVLEAGEGDVKAQQVRPSTIPPRPLPRKPLPRLSSDSPRFPLLEAYKAQLVSIPAGTLKREKEPMYLHEELLAKGRKLLGKTEPVYEILATLGAFKMGRTPVTVGMWQEYCAATQREMPERPSYPVWRDGWDAVHDHPIVRVSWEDCKTYADWANLALPSEAQWEYAASGGDERTYPWGDEWDPTKCQCSKKEWGDSGGTSPVGSYPAGPFGLYDMAGNVWEWCSDGDDVAQWVRPFRGASWFNFVRDYFMCDNRDFYSPGSLDYDRGFRLILQ